MNDPNYYNYHILINSQAFELTADRNNISNEYDPKVKMVLNEAKKILNKDINHWWKKDILDLESKKK